MQDGKQDPKNTLSRRALLTRSAVAASLALVARPAGASVCMPTPKQAEGPFYPVAHRLEEDNDLTWRHDREQQALGQVIEVHGQVTDADCAPLRHALVEIWQACASGRYDHPTDDNPAARDDNFQYWGRTATNDTGHYRFKTIKPGAYPMAPPGSGRRTFTSKCIAAATWSSPRRCTLQTKHTTPAIASCNACRPRSRRAW